MSRACLKLNCHTLSSPLQVGRLPSASVKVRPSCINFSMSTLHLQGNKHAWGMSRLGLGFTRHTGQECCISDWRTLPS